MKASKLIETEAYAYSSHSTVMNLLRSHLWPFSLSLIMTRNNCFYGAMRLVVKGSK